MTVGDLFEWLAAVALVVAGAVVFGVAGALVVAGVALVYFGQCYDTPLRAPKMRRRATRPAGTPWLPTGPPVAMFTCDVCGETTPQGEPHRCADAA